MTPTPPPAAPILATLSSEAIPLTAVEKELNHRVQALQSAGTGPVVRARAGPRGSPAEPGLWCRTRSTGASGCRRRLR